MISESQEITCESGDFSKSGESIFGVWNQEWWQVCQLAKIYSPILISMVRLTQVWQPFDFVIQTSLGHYYVYV